MELSLLYLVASFDEASLSLSSTKIRTAYLYIIEIDPSDRASAQSVVYFLETGKDLHFTSYQDMIDQLT